MKQVRQGAVLVILAALIGAGAGAASARAPTLGEVLKVGGIIFAVRQFGGEINRTINAVLAQRGVSYEGATKVVPIVSVGRGLYVGAAQVLGPPEQVRRTRAVGQVESRIGDLEGNLLIPTNTSTPSKNLQRVRGVGVGALIDFEI